MIDLTDKTIVISGGTAALISGIVASLQNSGAYVYPHDEHQLDTTDPVAVRDSLAAVERIDTMIILPMYYTTGLFMRTSPAMWHDALQSNYERAVYLSQATAQHMIDRSIAGSIIFVSTVALHMPLMQTSVYATSQAALYPLAKMAAVECGPHGIRVNTVACGWVESEWTAGHLPDEQARETVKAGIPLGEIAAPEAVGDVCCFLASPLARYITGSVIPVDGGYTLTRSEGTTPYPAG
jgi:3-oxoacyl-[acyl-carrier protein] reductase